MSQATSTDLLVQQFYTNPTIVADFKKYINDILTHVNPYTGLSYANDPTIFAYETGNEMLGPVWGDPAGCPREWVQDIARYVKSLAPKKLFVDGTYGINPTHLDVDEIDIFSNHYYPIDIGKLQSDLKLVKMSGRPYFAGEYDWIGQKGGDDMAEWFRVLEQSDVVIGTAFWSLFGRDDNCNVRLSVFSLSLSLAFFSKP